jgi:subtilisin family serine protease
MFPLYVLGQNLSEDNSAQASKNKNDVTLAKIDNSKKKEQLQKNKEAQKRIFRVKFKENFALKIENGDKKKSSAGYVQTGQTHLDKLAKQYGVTSIRRLYRHGGKFEQKHRKYGLHLWYELEVVDGAKTLDAISNFSKMTEVITAEPVYEKYQESYILTYKETKETFIGSLKNTPNDPQLNEQWHYYNIGQEGGTKGADIRLLDAWHTETGNPGVIVAVIDEGIDVVHSDLAANMWINKGEIPNNGIDDDNNGYIDDIYGFNLSKEQVQFIRIFMVPM